MDIEHYLETVSLIDCTGQISHHLTLLLDGTVRVRAGAIEAIIDPSSRTVRPPVRPLGRGEYSHDAIIDVACNLASGR